MMRRALSLMVIAGLGACKSNSRLDNPSAAALAAAQPMTAQELCALYENYNQNGNLCTTGSAKSAVDLSADALRAACRPGTEGYVWAEDLLEAIGNKRVSIDWAMSRDCLSKARELRAANAGYLLLDATTTAGTQWQALENGVCKDFFKGAVTEGGNCVDEWDCVAGTVCGSKTPWEPNSARCYAPGTAGAECQAYLGCADGFGCKNGTCSTLLAEGATCDPDVGHEDCASGYCEPEGFCSPEAAELAALGEPCATFEDCDGGCVSCRSAGPGGAKTCQLPGTQGAFCQAADDCLAELGCLNGKCGALASGAPCTGEVPCATSLTCTPTFNCLAFDGNPDACAETGVCAYDDTQGWCDPTEGICTRLPTDGECAFDLYCATGFVCDGGKCVAMASEGAACNDVAPCSAPFQCINSACALPCASNVDCASGEYCDSAAGACTALPVGSCNAATCAEGTTCVDTGTICTSYQADTAACNADPRCSYEAAACTFSFDCLALDGDEAACGAAGPCLYDPESGWCDPDPAVSCDEYTGNAADCASAPGCAVTSGCAIKGWLCFGTGAECERPGCGWDASTGQCVKLEAECVAQKEVGETCNVDLSGADCQSGDCSADDEDVYRCAVSLSRGCNRDAGFVHLVFLFGAVWGVWRRKR